MMDLACPQCGREQHYVCGRPDCTCLANLPEGALPQIVGAWDTLTCPYCGFEEHVDFWEELAMIRAQG